MIMRNIIIKVLLCFYKAPFSFHWLFNCACCAIITLRVHQRAFGWRVCYFPVIAGKGRGLAVKRGFIHEKSRRFQSHRFGSCAIPIVFTAIVAWLKREQETTGTQASKWQFDQWTDMILFVISSCTLCCACVCMKRKIHTMCRRKVLSWELGSCRSREHETRI